MDIDEIDKSSNLDPILRLSSNSENFLNVSNLITNDNFIDNSNKDSTLRLKSNSSSDSKVKIDQILQPEFIYHDFSNDSQRVRSSPWKKVFSRCHLSEHRYIALPQ